MRGWEDTAVTVPQRCGVVWAAPRGRMVCFPQSPEDGWSSTHSVGHLWQPVNPGSIDLLCDLFEQRSFSSLTKRNVAIHLVLDILLNRSFKLHFTVCLFPEQMAPSKERSCKWTSEWTTQWPGWCPAAHLAGGVPRGGCPARLVVSKIFVSQTSFVGIICSIGEMLGFRINFTRCFSLRTFNMQRNTTFSLLLPVHLMKLLEQEEYIACVLFTYFP